MIARSVATAAATTAEERRDGTMTLRSTPSGRTVGLSSPRGAAVALRNQLRRVSLQRALADIEAAEGSNSSRSNITMVQKSAAIATLASLAHGVGAFDADVATRGAERMFLLIARASGVNADATALPHRDVVAGLSFVCTADRDGICGCVFSAFDPEDTGELGIEAMERFLRIGIAMSLSLQPRSETDDDAGADEEKHLDIGRELGAVLAQQTFAEIDVDGSGSISHFEFESWITNVVLGSGIASTPGTAAGAPSKGELAALRATTAFLARIPLLEVSNHMRESAIAQHGERGATKEAVVKRYAFVRALHDLAKDRPFPTPTERELRVGARLLFAILIELAIDIEVREKKKAGAGAETAVDADIDVDDAGVRMLFIHIILGGMAMVRAYARHPLLSSLSLSLSFSLSLSLSPLTSFLALSLSLSPSFFSSDLRRRRRGGMPRHI